MPSENKSSQENHVIEAPLATAAIEVLPPKKSSTQVGLAAKLGYEMQFIRGRGAFEISIVTGLLVLFYIVYSSINPTGFAFLNSYNLSGVISQAVPVLAILSIASGILMVAGEYDLSLGPALTLNAIVFINVANGYGLVAGIVSALVSGIAVAVINGLIVVYAKIPSFIATLGMSFFWAGASLFINGTNAAMLPTPVDRTMEFLFAHDFGIFRSQLIWLAIVGIFSYVILHKHRFGNHVYAVGGNPAAAKAISINPIRVKLMAYGYFGLLSGLASILIAVRTTSVQPGGTATQDFTLFAIAAAVVGGSSLNGGKGSVIGMIVGAALIELIRNGLLLGHAPGFYITLFVGVTIVIAAVFNKIMEGKAS
jgi:simple sugar transport system permease protein